jgi:hypothetical protein
MATSRYGREGLPRSGFVQDPYCDLHESTDRPDKFMYFRGDAPDGAVEAVQGMPAGHT